MAITAGDFKAAGITVPLLVGGAALSEVHPHQNRAGYARPCVTQGRHDRLSLMNAIMDPARARRSSKATVRRKS